MNTLSELLRENSNMASNEGSDAVTMDKMESLIQRMSDVLRSEIKALEVKMEVMNAKLDGNTIEMNQRFAAVEERFVKSEAIMESTKEQIGLVENSLNIKIISVKDEVSEQSCAQEPLHSFLVSRHGILRDSLLPIRVHFVFAVADLIAKKFD